MENIKEFINKYVSFDCNNEEYRIDAFTDFIYLDKNLVDNDINEIRHFIVNNVALYDGRPSSYCLLLDSNGKPWNNLETLEDLRDFNIIYALAVVSNLITEDLYYKFYYYQSLGEDIIFFNNEEYSLEDFDMRREYMLAMRNDFVPKFNIYVDSCRKEFYTEKEVSTLDRGVLNLWFNDVGEISEEVQYKFDRLINTNARNLLLYVVYCVKNNISPRELLNKINNNEEYNIMRDINQYIKTLKINELNEFKKISKKIIAMLRTRYVTENSKTKIKKP